jgi:hypothetical protein
VADCPYEDKRFHNGDLKLKKNKKNKKEKEKKAKKSFTFNKKKKGGGYVVTWDSDNSDSDDDESSSDDERTTQRAIANIALSNKPSIFETTSTCLMAKPTKVKHDYSDDNSCASDDEEDKDYSKDDLLGIIDQMSKGYKRTTKKYKILEQEFIAKSNENDVLMEELIALKKSKECKGIEQELKALRKSFDELEASRECLKEDHEDL